MSAFWSYGSCAQARQEKNWQRSDEIRDALKQLGWAVEDTKQGQKITRL